MPQSIRLTHLNQLAEAAQKLLQLHVGKKHFAFEGEMGAGKTTFIKEICKALGSTENISSPTFSIVNQYSTARGIPIYHFDFYRLKNEQEAFDMGYEEYFNEKAYCLIEWPEKIKGLLPKDIIQVRIEVNNQVRTIYY